VDFHSHGRGRGFESPIAHSEKPLLSGGFFASGDFHVCDLLGARGRGHTLECRGELGFLRPMIGLNGVCWLHWEVAVMWS